MSNNTEQSTVIPAHQGWCLFFKICSSRLSSTALYWQEIQTEETKCNVCAKTHKFATIKCKPSKEFTRRGDRGSNQNYPLLLTENSSSMLSLCLLNVCLQPFSKYIPCHLGRNIKKEKKTFSTCPLSCERAATISTSLLRSATQSVSAEGFCIATLLKTMMPEHRAQQAHPWPSLGSKRKQGAFSF